MNKKEYLEQLKNELTLLPEEDRKKAVRSNRVKINTLINKGMSEEEALNSLGNVKTLAAKIYKSKGIKVEQEKNGIKDIIKNNINKKKKEPKVKTEKTKKEIVKKEEPKLEVIEEVIEEPTEELKTKKIKEDKKTFSLKNKFKKIKKTKVIETPLEETKEIIEEVKTTETENKKVVIDDVKTSSILLKEAMNLGCLIVALALIYYPFKMLNTYTMQLIGKLGLPESFNLVSYCIIYLLYVVICVTALFHYLSFITNNKKIEKINVLTQKVKKVVLIILEIPLMLFVLFVAALFFMVCFLFLDGFRVIGLPIAFFGLFLFTLMIYIALSNKIKNKQKSLFYSFVTYLIPLIIMAVGVGISYKDILDFDYVNEVDQKYTFKLYEKDYTLPESGKYRINFNTNYKTQYNLIEDKKLKNKVRVEITYYKEYYNLKTISDDSSLYISLNASLRRKFSIFLDNIQENEIYNLNELERYEVNIYYNPKDKKKFTIEN